MEHGQRRGLARLLLRWPEQRADLRRRALDDPYLLELIEAYESAWEAVEYWSRSKSAFASERMNEYRLLLLDTEDDILNTLSQKMPH